MRSFSRAVVLSPFVWVAVALSAMAGPMSLDDLSNSSSSDEVPVVESEPVENLDVLLETNLSSSSALSSFVDQLAGWIASLPPVVEQGQEVFHSDTGDIPPLVEQGTETGVLVTPDLLPGPQITVPEPSGGILAVSGVLFLYPVIRRITRGYASHKRARRGQ